MCETRIAITEIAIVYFYFENAFLNREHRALTNERICDAESNGITKDDKIQKYAQEFWNNDQ